MKLLKERSDSGPLPRDVPYHVLASPVHSPPPSPARSMSDEDSLSYMSEGV